jgi:hypothetical protein
MAVCDDGTLIPLTRDQARDNFLERGIPLSQELQRDDIAFVASAIIADKWTTRESVIEYVAEFRKRDLSADPSSAYYPSPQRDTTATPKRVALYYVPTPAKMVSEFGVTSPLHALDVLTSELVSRFDDAEWDAARAAYRLSLGARCFDADELATAQSEVDIAHEIMARLAFWRPATCWGAPLEDWRAHEGELQLRLDTRANDARYAGLRVEHLLCALVCDDDE